MRQAIRFNIPDLKMHFAHRSFPHPKEPESFRKPLIAKFCWTVRRVLYSAHRVGGLSITLRRPSPFARRLFFIFTPQDTRFALFHVWAMESREAAFWYSSNLTYHHLIWRSL